MFEMTAHDPSYVYIMASKRNGTLYVGVTKSLSRRVYEHKNDIVEGFTQKYRVHQLVYYEVYDDLENAVLREKRLKDWKRQWKLELVEKMNPDWQDLALELNA